MTELEQAVEQILGHVKPLPAESLSLRDACGRILLEPVLSPVNLPPWDNSAMDGYAVVSSDLQAAAPDQPVALKLVGQVAAGATWSGTLAAGQCLRIFTGSPLPQGSDGVIMQEDTRPSAGDPDTIECLDRIRPWENIRLLGEDIREGKPFGKSGTPVTAGLSAALAAMGVGRLKVHRQPVVGLLATGNELVEAGSPLAAGQIYESNRLSLANLIAQAGGIPHSFPIVPDTLEATESALRAAFQQCDFVITTGGASVGAMDFVKEAFEKLGGKLEFWKVRMKPGKPFIFGKLGDKLLFGLPGNPVSAWVTFLMLARPALRAAQGAVETALPTRMGVLGDVLANRGDRRHFIRVQLDTNGIVYSAGMQASHALGALATANGLVDVAPGTTHQLGESVRVRIWE